MGDMVRPPGLERLHAGVNPILLRMKAVPHDPPRTLLIQPSSGDKKKKMESCSSYIALNCSQHKINCTFKV